MTTSEIWDKNYNRYWVSFLYNQYLAGGLGTDFDSIRYWVSQFQNGETTKVILSDEGIVEDGNHRLVAAKISGIEDCLEV